MIGVATGCYGQGSICIITKVVFTECSITCDSKDLVVSLLIMLTGAQQPGPTSITLRNGERQVQSADCAHAVGIELLPAFRRMVVTTCQQGPKS